MGGIMGENKVDMMENFEEMSLNINFKSNQSFMRHFIRKIKSDLLIKEKKLSKVTDVRFYKPSAEAHTKVAISAPSTCFGAISLVKWVDLTFI